MYGVSWMLFIFFKSLRIFEIVQNKNKKAFKYMKNKNI